MNEWGNTFSYDDEKGLINYQDPRISIVFFDLLQILVLGIATL